MTRKHIRDIDGYKKRLLADYEKMQSWRKVAKKYGLQPNMARLIANGYDPGKKIRGVLGLPPRQEVEPCPRCGEAHVTKRCTRLNGGSRPPRIAIRKDNPESAANSILNNMETKEIHELIDILIRSKK